jgi:ABC-2 type transport system ATP-binding protein
MEIVKVEHLSKRYGDFFAVKGVSFEIKEGEIFGILGPNGAGKTTTLEMLEGLKSITEGRAAIAGHDVAKETAKVKSIIGVQLQASSFFDGLNLKELLVLFGSLYGRRTSPLELLDLVQLSDKAESMVRELSGGQKQRLSIASALVNEPRVLFLDEPTTGLDPQARRNLWELVKNIQKRGTTVVLTTHYMDEAEVLCSRIAIMDHGNIIALDTTPNLLRGSGVRSTIEFRTQGNCDANHLKSFPGVENVSEEDGKFVIFTIDSQQTLPALFSHAGNCAPILDLELRQPTLEDVFLKFTGRTLRE